MKKIYVGIAILLLSAGFTFAQECGPNCPVCSGAGSNAGALLSQRSVLISGLSIPTADEEKGVINTRYGILSWLDAGIGYAVQTEKVLWNVRAQPVLEKENSWRPGIILGSGSVQTGGSDQSIYAQLIKSVKISEILSLQLSTGVATLVPDFEKTYGLAGVTTSFKERYAVFASYDGESFHEGISWVPSDWVTLSFLMVESELPAFSIVFKR
ncbi:MAG: hypothetical protein KAR42_05085 [candidate division Zixibacteria bacterium]|nr:hypothetical protein [candidate division Zixibacteria bacterium]